MAAADVCNNGMHKRSGIAQAAESEVGREHTEYSSQHTAVSIQQSVVRRDARQQHSESAGHTNTEKTSAACGPIGCRRLLDGANTGAHNGVWLWNGPASRHCAGPALVSPAHWLIGSLAGQLSLSLSATRCNPLTLWLTSST